MRTLVRRYEQPEVPLARFPIRLVEQITEQGHGDFVVEAASAEEAAALVRSAYQAAFSAGTGFVQLPDGQAQLIERAHTQDVTISLLLLNGKGELERPIDVERLILNASDDSTG